MSEYTPVGAVRQKGAGTALDERRKFLRIQDRRQETAEVWSRRRQVMENFDRQLLCRTPGRNAALYGQAVL